MAARVEADPGTGFTNGAGPVRSRNAGARRVARRNTLPTGRAVVGGLLVAVSGVGLFAAATRSDTGPRQSYLVAAHALPAGARLGPADVARQPVDLPSSIRSRAFDDPAVVAGTTLLTPLAGGELLQASMLVSKPTGPFTRELSVPLDRGRILDGLRSGETVDLLATYGTGIDAFTATVASGVLVVGIDTGRGTLGQAGSAVLTVGIDDAEEAMAVAHASQVAKITPLRSTGVAESDDAPATYRPPAPPAEPAG